MNRADTAARNAAASKPKPIRLRFIVFMPFLWHARQRRARWRELIDLAQREPSAALIALHAAPAGQPRRSLPHAITLSWPPSAVNAPASAANAGNRSGRTPPAGHGDGRWLRDWLAALGVDLSTRVIHLRGVHYALIGHPKPDGTDHSKNFSDPSAGDLFTPGADRDRVRGHSLE